MVNKLYSFVDVDRSRKVRWMLAELELPYAEQRLSWKDGDQHKQEFRSVSPFGLVPAIDLDGAPIFESSAICAYLADLYPAKCLAPPVDSAKRADYMSWLFFAATTLENAVMEVIRWRKKPDDAERLAEAKEDLAKVFEVLGPRIAREGYLFDRAFSAVDVAAGFPIAVAYETGMLADRPELLAYVERLKSRPAAQSSRIFTATFPSA